MRAGCMALAVVEREEWLSWLGFALVSVLDDGLRLMDWLLKCAECK